MSATKETTIWCDLCSCWEQAAATAAQLRRALKAVGWTTTQAYGTKDFCPSCLQKKAEVLEELKAMSLQERSKFLENR